jgi:hypothetical protein
MNDLYPLTRVFKWATPMYQAPFQNYDITNKIFIETNASRSDPIRLLMCFERYFLFLVKKNILI